MAALVGAGIKAKMDEAGDEPITNEWVEQHGSAKVVKAYGRLGLYVASPDSGEWITIGPLAEAEM